VKYSWVISQVRTELISSILQTVSKSSDTNRILKLLSGWEDLNVSTIGPFKMLVTTYKTTQCHNPDDHNPNFHCHKNLVTH
jgi:hypothetical protein